MLLCGLVGYTILCVRTACVESAAVQSEYAQEYGRRGRNSLWPSVGSIAAGLGLLVCGSRWLVDGAIAAATALGVSELIIGLTIVAAGTSLPEVVTSLLATWRGERDIAVGNDVPVMTATAVACLPIFFTGHRIGRREGALLFAYYILYTAFLILAATNHDAGPAFGTITLAFVLPLTVMALGVSTARALAASRPSVPGSPRDLG